MSSSSLKDFSPPARYCGTAWINQAAIYVGLAPFAGTRSWIEAEELAKRTELLDDLVVTLHKKEIVFKKSENCSSLIGDVDNVHIAVTSNTVSTSLASPETIYGLSTGTPIALAKEWVENGLRSVNPVGYQTEISFPTKTEGKWRVILLRLATCIVHVFVSDPDATDCKNPLVPPNDICVIDGESVCDDIDEDDECEIVRSTCHKNFKLAC